MNTVLVVWGVIALPLGMLIGGSIALADRMERRPRPSRYPMKGGQVLMGPQQPRPRVQARIPGPPPRARRGGYESSGEPITEMPKAPSGPAPGGRYPVWQDRPAPPRGRGAASDPHPRQPRSTR